MRAQRACAASLVGRPVTRILATLGPSSLNRETVRACADEGVDLFRINLSHTDLGDVRPTVESIQSWTDVPVCLDSEGAQLRNSGMANGSVDYEPGMEVTIPYDVIAGNRETISFYPDGIATHFEPGDVIRVDFDHVEFEIVAKEADHCRAVVRQGGCVGSNKAADLDRDIPLAAISEKDRAAVAIGLEMGLSDFALSFANSAADVEAMREICGESARIICKIESRQGIHNLAQILDVADEILIDRGDLSRQVPIEKIPFLQRRIIATAKAHRKPVHVATNLLESMIVSRGPTRAEVNDVVSNIEMGADGLVLAAETAIGVNPVGAVKMIRVLLDEAARWTPNATIDDILG